MYVAGSPPGDPLTRFDDLGLIAPILRAVKETGYETPTPIQARAIPPLLLGRDLLGLAQTGTGKTAAFALPILQHLTQKAAPAGPRPIRALILSPTRELAAQIAESLSTYGKHLPLRHAVIFGGVSQRPQEELLRRGLDILVATPGRLLDLAGQRLVDLRRLEIFVLDEADRMLDMGFVNDVRRILQLLPAMKQSLFFSATMPPEAQALADGLLHNPETVAVTPVSSTAERIDQLLYFVEKADKRRLLVELLRDRAMARVLVFSRTKHGANRVAEHLEKARIGAAAIHGNKSQGARERALSGFKEGTVRVLVATDLAARGIDVDNITHVVNFDLPNVPETYVHRIGRTARAGASGIALSFCEMEERPYLIDIERLTQKHLRRVDDHAFRSSSAAPPVTDLASRRRGLAHPPQRPRGPALRRPSQPSRHQRR
jgi:ATP-dependent RNA helicase RhlE